ncbi:metallophosphoesterase family protein [Natronococcus sp. JC468]|uniref:metallophosphoesterase family protein n=1 Tax=Natronococcus sp. JC468 TaxID=1961921 RepID=UPI00143A6FB8|nr:metallophosphoesterase family protein [Natronococcus sp. JC468]NKE37256.1 metallophosphoesterase family protein [Natronococcus sp. JC468]
MKIGLISDVHGNQPALTTVLSDMPAVDQIYHLGDIVGYNPFPGEVLRTFEKRGIRSIQGNHDRNIGGDIDAIGSAPEPDTEDSNTTVRPSDIARAAGKWTFRRLTDEQRRYISTIPEERTLRGGIVKLVHGKPGEQDGRLYPDEYGPHLFAGERILAHGHTHVQHAERFDEKILVNPGSVGQPRDGDSRAAYAVLDLDSNSVQLHRVAYPIEEVTDAIRQTSIPDELCSWLERGEIVTE